MPEMDGYEATKVIRQHESEHDLDPTPIIAITADAIKGAKECCLSVGMDDYITKPIDQEKLIMALKEFLPYDSKVVGIQSGSEIEDIEDAKQGGNVPLDLSHLHLFTEGDAEEERDLLALFFDQNSIGIDQLSDFYEAGDDEGWKKTAHRMKGAAANLGAQSLSDACKDAEEGFDAGKAIKSKLLENIRELNSILKQYCVLHTQYADQENAVLS